MKCISKTRKKCLALLLTWILVLTAAGAVQVHADEYRLCSVCGGSGRSMCPMCAGTGQRSFTIFQTQTIGWNSVTGMAQTIQMPVTQHVPCSTCSGSGRMFCSSCSGTGRVRVSSGSSSSGSSGTSGSSGASGETETSASSFKKVKYGTVIDATDGIGDYEDAPNLIDGKKDTKFNVKAKSAYIIWKAPKMLKVTSYVIMTGNDTATYKGRNPKTWVLYGSNKKLPRSASGWKKIHAVTNDKKLKNVNYKNYTYKLKKTAKAYRYYKLEIKDNKGADCTQLSGLTLKGKTVTVKKTSISSAKRTGTKLKLKWKKVSGASGYQIQYSRSPKFKSAVKVKVKGASKRSKTISKLKKGRTYYVRVRAYKTVNGGTVYSSWSAKRKV